MLFIDEFYDYASGEMVELYLDLETNRLFFTWSITAVSAK